mmetsp:Transcript_3943/g.5153  ORF Transcript_3943/g.5153 Transcript_3943/m.5153 type:complete len:84 (+) Transcript_3943:453-704(+)
MTRSFITKITMIEAIMMKKNQRLRKYLMEHVSFYWRTTCMSSSSRKLDEDEDRTHSSECWKLALSIAAQDVTTQSLSATKMYN